MIAYNVSLLGKTADPETLAKPIAYVKTARGIEREDAKTQGRKEEKTKRGEIPVFFASLRLCVFAFSSFF